MLLRSFHIVHLVHCQISDLIQAQTFKNLFEKFVFGVMDSNAQLKMDQFSEFSPLIKIRVITGKQLDSVKNSRAVRAVNPSSILVCRTMV